MYSGMSRPAVTGKHTPGPWHADIRAYGYEVRPEGQQRECWSCETEAQPLARHTPVLSPADTGPTPYVPLTAEQAANARLIAATPELLEACKAAMRIAPLWLPNPPPPGPEGDTEIEALHSMARLISDAVAKATTPAEPTDAK